MRIKAYLVGLVCLILGGQVLFAQVTTGTISGTVSDSTGAVLPGAKVVILNEDTGLSRTLQTDAAGRYSAPALSLGQYRVTAGNEGFQTKVRSGIAITVGREAVVNLQLEVGAVNQTVEVTGEAPLVESTSAAVGSLVDERTIRDLPLNGRSYDQLALLQAGVTAYGGGSPQGGNGFDYGAGKRFSVSGGRTYTNSFLLDGTDINDAANGTPGGATGLNLGVEGIREFKILTNAYSAEYGRASGAVVNSVTKSGTNQLHGVLFHFLRNSALDARNFFDRDPSNPSVRGNPPPFKRNQFGGALGGPIKKDRTFFFGVYEGLRQRLATTQIALVPTVDAKNGILPVLDSRGSVTGTRIVPVNPSVKPFLTLWPNPNGNTYPDGTGDFVSSPSNPTGEDYFMVRIDHQLSQKNALFGRYSYDNDSVSIFGNSTSPLLNAVAMNAARRQYSTLQWSSTFSPVLLNNFRFAYNRSVQTTDTQMTIKLGPEFSLVPGQPIGVLAIGGKAALAARTYNSLGTSDSAPRTYFYNLFEWGDDLTWIRGKHSFMVGGSAKRMRDNTATNTSLRGIYTFDTFETVLTGTPNNFAAVRPGESAYRGLRQSIIAMYGQDDFQVSPRLTLNLGLRWEFATDPTEANHMVSNLIHITDPKVTLLDHFFTLGKKNLQPRVGFAWQMNSKGTSVVRGGFGIFHDQILPIYYALQVNKYPPFYELLNVSGTGSVRFPDGFVQLSQGGLLRLNAIAPHLKTPAKYHYTLSFQQQLFANTVLEIGYVGSHASNVARFAEQNSRAYTLVNRQKFFGTSRILPRKNPNFDEVRTILTDTNVSYNGLQLKFRRQSSRGLQFQASYTYSKTLDEASGIATADTARDAQASLDPEDPARDKGRASFDATHNVVISLSYPIPGRYQQRAASFLLGGWEIGEITTLTSGLPFSARLGFEQSNNGGGGRADRPNLAPGAKVNPSSGVGVGCAGLRAGDKLGTPDRWYDPCAFTVPALGFYGTLGRNTLVGPGITTFDLSLVKGFRLHERANLQFRAEAFNIFNHANFGLPASVPLASNGSAVATAGRMTDTVTSARQIQFALKLTF